MMTTQMTGSPVKGRRQAEGKHEKDIAAYRAKGKPYAAKKGVVKAEKSKEKKEEEDEEDEEGEEEEEEEEGEDEDDDDKTGIPIPKESGMFGGSSISAPGIPLWVGSSRPPHSIH
ncbi:hypothetical protein A6R68_10522 [Neotoma lepida]|uniref:Uncharacterized protein n=1 Tax=Neotoma lepida TaxID=56216 RepID=A0A1A6FWV0_NEOLE|nr:hypothetical protein A6R68_10522 [Neotoma lepida]